MSEFKGQLLGILLVVLVFAAIGVTVGTMFTDFADDLRGQVSQAETTAISIFTDNF